VEVSNYGKSFGNPTGMFHQVQRWQGTSAVRTETWIVRNVSIYTICHPKGETTDGTGRDHSVDLTGRLDDNIKTGVNAMGVSGLHSRG
jgi:hypothetical protein